MIALLGPGEQQAEDLNDIKSVLDANSFLEFISNTDASNSALGVAQ